MTHRWLIAVAIFRSPIPVHAGLLTLTSHRGSAWLLLAALFACIAPAWADDACGLNEVRLDFKRLAPASSTISEWVQARVIDVEADQPRTVRIDGALVAIAFSRHVESSTMEAPRDFTFRSGWLLNTQFAFRKGDRFRIRARYDVPSGATFYALMPPGEPYLTIFARPDGTLCNKVMNTNAGDHGFLVREYKSSPSTKLTMDTQAFQEEPLVLKIAYLGTAGGIASFREVWSRQGWIVQTADHAFDPEATNLRIAGIDVTIIAMDSSSVTSHAKAPAPRLAWNAYWSRQFERCRSPTSVQACKVENDRSQ